MQTEDYYKINLYRSQVNYLLLRDWMDLKNCNRPLYKYFTSRNYKNIALYGLGDIGQLFLDEITKSDIKVLYAVDVNADNLFYKDVPVIKPDGQYLPVDIIVVSVVFAFDDIALLLKEKTEAPAVSLMDVIHSS